MGSAPLLLRPCVGIRERSVERSVRCDQRSAAVRAAKGASESKSLRREPSSRKRLPPSKGELTRWRSGISCRAQLRTRLGAARWIDLSCARHGKRLDGVLKRLSQVDS